MSYMWTWLSSNGAQQKCDRSKRQRRAGALGRTWGGTVHLVDYATSRVNPFPAPEIGRYGRRWKIAPVCPRSPPSTIPVFPPVD